MANQSIYNAFERMWQHTVARFEKKVDINQGVENYGKILAIDEEGNATPSYAPDVMDVVYHGDEEEKVLEFIAKGQVLAGNIGVDPSLTLEGHVAEAKAVGDKFKEQATYNEETYAKKGEVPEYDMTVVDDGQGNLTFGTDVTEVISTDAKDSGYNNTNSGLNATNVQDAIDELTNKIGNVESDSIKIGPATIFWNPEAQALQIKYD